MKKVIKTPEVDEIKALAEELIVKATLPPIAPLTQSFGNGELNTLRDKINELISRT